MSIEASFERLVGRAPGAAELVELLRIKDALALSEDDPLWVIFFALRHHESLYSRIPAQIDDATARLRVQADRLDRIEKSRASAVPANPWTLPIRITAATITAATITAALLGLGIGYVTFSPTVDEAALENCFAGRGRVERRAGETLCFPVGANGQVFGFRIK